LKSEELIVVGMMIVTGLDNCAEVALLHAMRG
jgi:hypothetical protein